MQPNALSKALAEVAAAKAKIRPPVSKTTSARHPAMSNRVPRRRVIGHAWPPLGVCAARHWWTPSGFALLHPPTRVRHSRLGGKPSSLPSFELVEIPSQGERRRQPSHNLYQIQRIS